MSRARSHLSSLLVAALLSGCGGEEAAAPLVIEPVVLGFEGRTTDGETACGNLDAQIESLVALARRSHGGEHVATLVPLLLTRSQLRGDIADVDTALALAGTLADPATRGRLEASAYSALHEWGDALARFPSSDPSAEAFRESVALARGEDVSAILAHREERARRTPSLRTETDLAIALGEAGRYDEADAAYRRALAAYRDVSPFPIALVQFQRGVMWAERAGRPGRAVALYREAVRRVPTFVVANVHLAELELEMGTTEPAIARLRRMAELSPDPEPSAVLAEALRVDSPAEARRHLARARARYRSLLGTHRLAYADHAAELYLGVGRDPARASELAMVNLENRHTERAYELAIRAAFAADDATLACSVARDAARSNAGAPPRTAGLRETLAHAEPRCP